MIYVRDLCKPQDVPKVYMPEYVLLVMKRCISCCVLFLPLTKQMACNKCDTSQLSIQRTVRPV